MIEARGVDRALPRPAVDVTHVPDVSLGRVVDLGLEADLGGRDVGGPVVAEVDLGTGRPDLDLHLMTADDVMVDVGDHAAMSPSPMVMDGHHSDFSLPDFSDLRDLDGGLAGALDANVNPGLLAADDAAGHHLGGPDARVHRLHVQCTPNGPIEPASTRRCRNGMRM